MNGDVPEAVSSLNATYYYWARRGYETCFRAGLRISWTLPRDGLLFPHCSSAITFVTFRLW